MNLLWAPGFYEHRRDLQTAQKDFGLTVPAHSGDSCRDVTVRCIKFVLPEDLDVSGSADSLCNRRKFKAKFISHYIDNDFECCNVVL